ncbi:MAG: hypothetical protein AB1679_02105 [Actinomycetota bacterium]
MDLARFNCRVTRPHHRVALLEVTSPHHQEFFSISEGDRTLAVTVLDVTNPTFSEPRSYSIEKPAGWRTDIRAEELLLSIWNALLPG